METEFFPCEKVMSKVEINILLVTRKRDENRSEIFISSGRNVERTDINIKIDSFKSIRRVSIPLLCRFPNFSPPFFLCFESFVEIRDDRVMIRLRIEIYTFLHTITDSNIRKNLNSSFHDHYMLLFHPLVCIICESVLIPKKRRKKNRSRVSHCQSAGFFRIPWNVYIAEGDRASG